MSLRLPVTKIDYDMPSYEYEGIEVGSQRAVTRIRIENKFFLSILAER